MIPAPSETRGITREQAVVYRGGGRRWFTKRAAANATARQAIRARCDCEPAEHAEGYPGNTCYYHRDPERYARLVRTLAYFAMRRLS